ncbi:MAG: nitrate/nitrite transporter NrtS [Kofleriaceae bacterium]
MARALWIAAGVGTFLLVINHGDHLLREPLCPHFYLKAGLTYLTPFFVSLLSNELAARRAA